MSLEKLLGDDNAENIKRQLDHAPFRRLSEKNETYIKPEWLCQAFHINRLTGEPKLILGDQVGGYYMHSIESIKPSIDKMLNQNIKRVYLGTDAVIGEEGSYLAKLNDFANILVSLRAIVGPDVEIIVDPAGLCLRKDLRWGVTAEGGDINAQETLALLAQAAVTFEEAGANALLTIGRSNCEVAAVKQALQSKNKDMRVLSFSTNSETTSAYFEVTQHDILRSRTGQKIFVGNIEEMLVRAICDFGEGSDVIVQKPVESFHLPAILRLLSEGLISFESLMDNSETIDILLNNNPHIRPAFNAGVELLKSKKRILKTGTYEVSGTYSTIQLIINRYSEQLGWSMLDEILLNAASAAGKSLDIMISRNATWYLEKRGLYSIKES